MILYEETIEHFNEDVMQNRIADRAAEKYSAYYRRNPGDSEYRSWAISLAILNNSFAYAGLKDNHIVVEYELPYASQRIDVLLFGCDVGGRENIAIMELKQWSNDNVKNSESEGNIIVNYGRFKKEQPHPSLQVQGYYFGLKDFVKIFEGKNAPELSASVYAHNYSKQKDAILLSSRFSELVKTFPIFTKEEAVELGRYLKERLQGGKGQTVYEHFARSPIGPSKKLLDHTSDMINKQQIFNLIDEQIVAYNAIMHKAKQLVKAKKKSVVIVKGGPGTGKSVIALEVMGELLRRGRKVMHATGSSAFTNTLRKIVGVRAKNLFKFFNSFSTAKADSFDVLICDEAHRMRESSVNRYTPRAQRTNLPQIDELLAISKLNIFFIDEDQVVRPNEVGNVAMIRDASKRFGVEDLDIIEFELKTQFRCSGSDAYLQWIDKVLGIRGSDIARYDPKMEFRIFDSPSEMMEEIRARNKEKINSARITAGFCWPWSNPNNDGILVKDVKIGDFEMPWEKKDAFWKWATDDSGMEQVGTVYTAQGFEFDYIGVIFGKDLVYDLNKKKWISQPENSYDKMVTRNNADLTKHLKQVYRVLMSRAHKGVYVYFMDEDTKNFFKNSVKNE
ncbi:MAG: DUF2075 domain-containing protein [Candidatus Levybacteria bacterium]|nr:DUF2075 domain-containing protein [Candidatus Levybacteria bacterium]